jgi:hypothetical protein
MRSISWLAEELLALQEEVVSVQLIVNDIIRR